MMPLFNSLLVVVLLLNFLMLGTSRIRSIVQAAALQGIVLGILPLMGHHELRLSVVLVCAATILMKGFVIPGMLYKAMRSLPIKREVEPLVGLIPSMLLGAVGAAMAIVFARRLPLAEAHSSGMIVPAALATVLTGFLILTTRIKAITQAVGYLVLENGVFIFGLLLIEALPLMVEMGVLLDLVVGIFVMGIIISQINREFASEDIEESISALKE